MSPSVPTPKFWLLSAYAVFLVLLTTPIDFVYAAPEYSLFASLTSGSGPDGNLVEIAGVFYGTTFTGGSAGKGTIFSISSTGTVNVLHNFGDGSIKNDGANPREGLVEGADGNLYGVTQYGGNLNEGTAYLVTPSGGVSILHSFGDPTVTNDGWYPWSRLVQAPNGNFYGETVNGGSFGYGTIYEITTGGSVVILHSFGDGSVYDDGANPHAGLIRGTDGNFYGTTEFGGADGLGTVFQVTPSGAVTILHSFNDGTVNNDGKKPNAVLLEDADGNFLGTTVAGGSANEGTVFKITPAGVVTILHSFGDGTVLNDGSAPWSGLLLGLDGNYYGSTSTGGEGGEGTLYDISATGSVTVFHSFADGTVANDAATPYRGLSEGSDGNFYGLGYTGGTSGTGAAYKVIPNYSAPVPTITPDGGGFNSVQSVSISDYLTDATIYYTSDGTTPTESSTEYTGPFQVSSWETVEAIAVADGFLDSSPAIAKFEINLPVPQPTITPGGGSYSGTQTVTIADSESDASLLYSTNASSTSPIWAAYTGPINVSKSETVSAVAETTHNDFSDITTATFTIAPGAYANFSAGLQLLSLPATFAGESLDTVFGLPNVQAAVWNPVGNTYAISPTSPANEIVDGQGYWVRLPSSSTVVLNGTFASTAADFVIHLSPGWNMIGDPFNASIPLSSVLFDGQSLSFQQATEGTSPLVNPNFYYYVNGSNSYSYASSLDPNVGYWVDSYTSVDLDVPPPT